MRANRARKGEVHNSIDLNKPLEGRVLFVFNADKGECVYCGSRHHLTMDHIIPHSKGGTDSRENLVLACVPCNHSRGDGDAPPMRFGRFR